MPLEEFLHNQYSDPSFSFHGSPYKGAAGFITRISWDYPRTGRYGQSQLLELLMYSELDRVLLQEQNAGLTLPDVIPTSIARVVTAPLHMILAEHMLLFAKTWTSRIATWTPWGERLSITSLLEEIEMIQNTCYGLECPKCLYHVNAVYGSGFVGYPGEATLRNC